MINRNIVKENYQRMPDEELIRFAKNESGSLTLESFHLLKSECESRNIDINIIESAQTDRELADVLKLSEFEKKTASDFNNIIWQFAFDEKEKGKSNAEIFNALINKNIGPEYAYMLVESMESKAMEIVDNYNTQIIVGWIFLIIGALLVFVAVNSTSITRLAFIWGSLSLLAGLIRLYTSSTKKIKFETIIKNIKSEKEEFDNTLSE